MPQNYSSCFPANTPPTPYPSPASDQTNFPIEFNFLKESDVVVFKKVSGTWTIVALTDYSIVGTDVVFGTAPNTDVVIFRKTDICNLVRTYQAGQSIRAQDLNNSLTQFLYLYQEIYEYISYMMGGDELLPEGDTLEERFWNQTTDTITSSDTWLASDSKVATTSAIQQFGDARWLNDTGGIIGGDSITATESSGQVDISIDLATNGGLESTNDGNPAGQLRVNSGNGIVVNSSGVNVQQGIGTTVSTGVNVIPVSLWGQNHNHTASVVGSMTNVGDITFQTGGGTLNGASNEDIQIATSGSGTFDVDRNTTIDGTVDITGNTSVTGTASVTGNTTVGGTLAVTGDTTLSGSIGITNNVTVGGTLGVTGNTTLGGTLGVTGNTTLGGTLGVTGATSITGNLDVDGNTTFGNSPSDTHTFDGDLTILGGGEVKFNGNDTSGGGSIKFVSPTQYFQSDGATVTDFTYTWPSNAPGGTDRVLTAQSDGSLSWTAKGSGGDGGAIQNLTLTQPTSGSTDTIDVGISDGGTGITILEATDSRPGVMTATQADKLSNIQPNAQVNVNPTQSYTAAASTGTLTLSPGSDTTVIPAATATVPGGAAAQAGLMTGGDKDKLDGYPATPGGVVSGEDLATVTGRGNHTNQNILLGNTEQSPNTTLGANGSARFGGTNGDSYVNIGSRKVWLANKGNNGITSYSNGGLLLQASVGANSNTLMEVDAPDVSTANFNVRYFRNTTTTGSPSIQICSGDGTSEVSTELKADGSATFTGATVYKGAPYTADLDVPCVVFGTKNYSGSWDNWGTYGYQFRLRSDSDGISRLALTTAAGNAEFEPLSVTSALKIGISTTEPIAKLHVNGAIASSKGQITSGVNYDLSQANVLVVPSAGIATMNQFNNASEGQTGVFILEGPVGTWHNSFYFQGGSVPNIDAAEFPAVIPWVVSTNNQHNNPTVVYCGNPVKNLRAVSV